MRRHNVIALAACIGACLTLGCSKPASESNSTTKTSSSTASTGSAASDHHHAHGENDHAHDHDDHDHAEPCEDDGASSKILYPTPTKSKDKDGKEVTHFGPDFTVEQPTTVEEIRKASSKFIDKTVRMEGFITAGCKRRRGWFAIVNDRRSGNPMRVLTTPSFRVPVDAVGKRVRVEGKVKTIEISAAKARHLAKEHALPLPEVITDKVKQTVLMASSADFY